MTKKPWLNFFFTILLQSFSLLFLLLCSYYMGIIAFEGDVTAESENERNFIFHCVALTLISLMPYIIFFIIQRRKSNNRKYLGYLKMPTRIILSICVLLANVALVILFCLLPGYMDTCTLFFAILVDTQTFIFPLIVFILLNLLPFIFFKPRP